MKQNINCKQCNVKFSPRRRTQQFCSNICGINFNKLIKLQKYNIEIKCTQCNNEFFRTKKIIDKTQNHFCSRSCAVKYNNKLPKRKLKISNCKKCGNNIKRLSYKDNKTLCDTCFNLTLIDPEKITLQELTGERKYQKHSRVRELSRKLYFKLNLSKKCAICNYDKHIEICHIKAIKAFDMTSKLSEINSSENLIGLCPNCHWEFDSGLISEEFIRNLKVVPITGFEPVLRV